MQLKHVLIMTIVLLVVYSNTLSARQIPNFLRPKENEAVSWAIIKKWQLTWWVEVGKPDEEIKPDDTLMDAARKAESKKLNIWLTQGASTYDVWVKLGLNKLPFDEVYKSPEFDTYARYVKLFDDFMIAEMKAGRRPVFVSKDATSGEMSTRVMIYKGLVITSNWRWG